MRGISDIRNRARDVSGTIQDVAEQFGTIARMLTALAVASLVGVLFLSVALLESRRGA